MLTLLTFFQNFQKIIFRHTIRVSNGLSVLDDLGLNCFQRLSADNTSSFMKKTCHGDLIRPIIKLAGSNPVFLI